MGNLGNYGFDANQVDPTSSFDVIPAGTYMAVATESEIKATKSGSGEILNITFEVVDGEFKGRKVWARINVRNTNPKAQEIGQKQLSGLCHATGVLQPQDSAEFHGKPVKIKVKISKQEGYGESNEIVAFEGATASKAAPQTTTAPRAPWQK